MSQTLTFCPTFGLDFVQRSGDLVLVDGSNCGMAWDELKDVNQLAVSVSIILDAPHTETHGHEAQVKYCIEYVHSF